MSQQEQVLYEFEGFVLDPVRRLLTRDGQPVPLPPKAVATLLVLVERHGRVVDKEELFQMVWPDTFITEATLTQNVFRLRKALGEEAGEHRFIVTVPGRGYSFVADLQRRELSAAVPAPPEAPPVSAAEDTAEPVRAAAPPPVEPASGGPEPGIQAPGAPKPRRWALAGLALGLAVLVVVALLIPNSPFRPSESPPAPAAEEAVRPPRRSVAVLGFRNLSGRRETAWLSTALAEMFTGELGAGERLHTITGERVTRAKRDLRLGDPENLSQETLALLRENLSCDVVLLGSYLTLGAEGGHRLRVDLRLQDAASGETLSFLTKTRSEEELFELVSQLGQDLREALGTGPVSRQEVASSRAAFPASKEASRLYAEGLEHLRALDTLAALDRLQRATRAEPGYPLAHAALASAWSTLGYDANAEQEAAQALALSGSLSREDRLLVEALHAETRKEWAKAVDIYDSLWRFFPDELEHGLHLAQAEIAAGRAQRSLTTVADLRRLPAPLADDPRIDLVEAEAAAALSDYARQQRAAAEATEKGRKLGARLLTAQALNLQGHALRSLGRQQEALARIQEAEAIFSAAGDRVGVAGAIHDIANLLRDRGDSAGARQQYERALAVHREAGNQRGILRALTNLGGMALQEGDYDRAQTLLREVVEISREIHDRLSEARGLSNLGGLLREQGKLQAAQRAFQDALARFRAVGNVVGETSARTNLAAVYLGLGKLPDARREAATAVRLSRQIKHPRSLGFALNQLGPIQIEDGQLGEAEAAFREMNELAGRTGHKLLLADARAGLAQVQRLQGKLPEAQQNARRALGLWVETHERQQAAAGRLALARLSLDAGRTKEAEQEARAALEGFQALRLTDGEARARATLATALLARGETDAAVREIRSALELTTASQDRRARLAIAIISGRTAGAQGRIAEARRTLTAARDQARALGLRPSALDAALALAELDVRQGNPAALQDLQSLREDAALHGFLLAAQRADQLHRELEALTNPRRF